MYSQTGWANWAEILRNVKELIVGLYTKFRHDMIPMANFTSFYRHFRPLLASKIGQWCNIVTKFCVPIGPSDDPGNFSTIGRANFADILNMAIQIRNSKRLKVGKKKFWTFFLQLLCSEFKTTSHMFDIKNRAPSL